MVWFEVLLTKVPKKVGHRVVKLAISLRILACANIEQRILYKCPNTTSEKYPCMYFPKNLKSLMEGLAHKSGTDSL
jgi:hypothetical protein